MIEVGDRIEWTTSSGQVIVGQVTGIKADGTLFARKLVGGRPDGLPYPVDPDKAKSTNAKGAMYASEASEILARTIRQLKKERKGN